MWNVVMGMALYLRICFGLHGSVFCWIVMSVRVTLLCESEV